MKVTFTKTGERRYRIDVEGKGIAASYMDPAPGYDPLLPHDMAHFVVENTLGLIGVFGQLAGGGNAKTFRPVDERKKNRAARRGRRISTAHRKDAELSEKVIFVAQRTWMKGDMTDVPEYKEVSAADIDRVCSEFERVSRIWSKLAIGESMALEWTAGKRAGRRP